MTQLIWVSAAVIHHRLNPHGSYKKWNKINPAFPRALPSKKMEKGSSICSCLGLTWSWVKTTEWWEVQCKTICGNSEADKQRQMPREQGPLLQYVFTNPMKKKAPRPAETMKIPNTHRLEIWVHSLHEGMWRNRGVLVDSLLKAMQSIKRKEDFS